MRIKKSSKQRKAYNEYYLSLTMPSGFVASSNSDATKVTNT